MADAPAAPGRTDQVALWLVLIAASAVLAYLVINLVLTLAGVGPTLNLDACLAAQPPGHVTGPPLQPPLPVLDPPVIRWAGLVIALCFAGFVVGNLWGRRRAVAHTRAADPTSGTLGPPSTLLQVVLVALLAVGAGALVFETLALARVQDQPHFWPITFYVRCANDVLSLPTLVGAVLVSSVVGHLLGYQAKAGETA